MLENELKPCVEARLSAVIYPQTSDVEIDLNGFLTYDREAEKMDFRRVRKAHMDLWENVTGVLSISVEYLFTDLGPSATGKCRHA